jgi:hypothetical protein
MSKLIVVLSCIAGLLLSVSASAAGNVILLTLDGVRWQEVFHGDENGKVIFKHLLGDDRSGSVIFGNVDRNERYDTSNDMLMSLPAYQSIMAGTVQPCEDNNCGRIKVETFEERAVSELKLDRTQVATIASWDNIRNSVEHVQGSTFVSAYMDPVNDGTPDPESDAITAAQLKDVPPWEVARYDRYTWAHAMHYLKKHKPRFLFISLDDSDEWGHKFDWPSYIGSLKQYDQWIHELIGTLKEMGQYGDETTLIVTTDHGRGDGSNWGYHGWFWPESRAVWFYARAAKAAHVRRPIWFFENGYTHSDLRPTIESALGLTPRTCDECGHVIRGIAK